MLKQPVDLNAMGQRGGLNSAPPLKQTLGHGPEALFTKESFSHLKSCVHTYQMQESLPQLTWAESDSAKGLQRNTVREVLTSR